MTTERSCGAVLYRMTHGEPMYVLVKARHFGFPKGHVENDETDEQTALREIKEETGVSARLDSRFRREVTYMLPGHKRICKKVVLFVAEFDEHEDPHACSEIKKVVMEPYAKAMQLVSHESLKNVLEEAHSYILSRAD